MQLLLRGVRGVEGRERLEGLTFDATSRAYRSPEMALCDINQALGGHRSTRSMHASTPQRAKGAVIGVLLPCSSSFRIF